MTWTISGEPMQSANSSVRNPIAPGREHRPSRRLARSWAGFWALALATGVFLAGCSDAPDLVGLESKPPLAESASSRDDIRLYIATSRQPSAEEGVFYSGDRSWRTNFASVDVAIPLRHQPGKVELPNDPPPDPERHFVLHGEKRFADSEEFLRNINQAIRQQPVGKRSALVFVHGYNTNLTEAIARFAQLVEDTGYEGIPILFSWPSARRTIDYVTDLNSAAYSRDDLAKTFLLLNRTQLESYDVIAHSMGNFVMMETARTAALRGEFDRLGRLRTIVMASPDIDVWLFTRQLIALPPSVRSKIHILVSRDDRALAASRRIAGNYPRVGAADPEALSRLGVTVVDLTQINDTSSIHHSKFRESPEIVRLLGTELSETDNLSTDVSGTGVFLERVGGVVNVLPSP